MRTLAARRALAVLLGADIVRPGRDHGDDDGARPSCDGHHDDVRTTDTTTSAGRSSARGGVIRPDMTSGPRSSREPRRSGQRVTR